MLRMPSLNDVFVMSFPPMCSLKGRSSPFQSAVFVFEVSGPSPLAQMERCLEQASHRLRKAPFPLHFLTVLEAFPSFQAVKFPRTSSPSEEQRPLHSTRFVFEFFSVGGYYNPTRSPFSVGNTQNERSPCGVRGTSTAGKGRKP